MLILQQCGCLEAEYFPLVAVPGLHRRTSQPFWGKNGTKTFGGVAEQTPCKKDKEHYSIPSAEVWLEESFHVDTCCVFCVFCHSLRHGSLNSQARKGVQLSPASAAQWRGINAKKRMLLHASKWQQAHGDLPKIYSTLQASSTWVGGDVPWSHECLFSEYTELPPFWYNLHDQSLDSVQLPPRRLSVSERHSLFGVSFKTKAVGEGNWKSPRHLFPKSFFGVWGLYYQNQSWFCCIYLSMFLNMVR